MGSFYVAEISPQIVSVGALVPIEVEIDGEIDRCLCRLPHHTDGTCECIPAILVTPVVLEVFDTVRRQAGQRAMWPAYISVGIATAALPDHNALKTDGIERSRFHGLQGVPWRNIPWLPGVIVVIATDERHSVAVDSCCGEAGGRTSCLRCCGVGRVKSLVVCG